MDVDEAPPRVSESDFGARNRIIERSVPLPFRVVAAQGVVALMLTLAFLLLGRSHVTAGLLAGVVVIAPNAVFAWRVAASVRAGQEQSAARRLVGGAIAKQLAMIALLIAVFAAVRPDPLGFFATMIAMQGVVWLAPWFDSDA